MDTLFEAVEAGINGGYFIPPKPKNEQDDDDRKIIAGLESAGQLMIQRKHDGNGHLTMIGANHRQIDIFTLGLNPVADKYPHLVTAMRKIRFPQRTLICGEIFCTVGGVHDRYAATRLTSSGIVNALNLQKNGGVYPEMAFFNPLIWNGEDATKWSNHDRYHCVLDHLKRSGSSDQVKMTELVEASLAEARAIVKKSKWEGLVLYDRKAPTRFTLGTPGEKDTRIPRPPGVWKDKEGIEVDFVAYDFVRSTAGSHKDGVKDFYIGLIDPNTGDIIPCGLCGNGLKREDRFKFAKPGMLPVAVEVKFEQWSKNGKTLLGGIERIRDPDDKHFTQCLATEAQLEKYLTKERIKRT